MDEGVIAAGDARASSAIHPLVAQRQDACPARVGRVVALDPPYDGIPQPSVLRPCKMLLKEFSDRHIGGIMELDNLGSVESFTIAATCLPRCKFSVRSGTSLIET